MIIDKRHNLPNEDKGYLIERRQHRRQVGTRIRKDYAFQCWEPQPVINRVKPHPVLKTFLAIEIIYVSAVIAAVLVGWLS